jgi:uncharacterized protein (DUF58 family)
MSATDADADDDRLAMPGAVAGGLAIAAVGVLTKWAVLLLAGGVPLLFVLAVESASPPPALDALEVRRTVRPTPVAPGRDVGVELAIRNDADRRVHDVRVLDGVPSDLVVSDGAPRGASALDPGETLSVTYAVTARRGTHDFADPVVRIRSRFGEAADGGQPTASGQARIECRLDVEDVPVRPAGAAREGSLPAHDTGAGLRFHSVREYRHGDSLHRIDWRHFAKRGELATVNYHRERSATAVLVLDARSTSAVTPAPGHPGGVELGAYAASHAAERLLARGHQVGLAIVGVDATGTSQDFRLPPSAAGSTLGRLRNALDAAASRDPATEHRELGERHDRDAVPPVLQRHRDGAQYLWFTPLIDDAPVAWIRRARAVDAPCRVVSPDVTARATAGGSIAGVDRRCRLHRCRDAGCRVVDWSRRTPLTVALDTVLEEGGP